MKIKLKNRDKNSKNQIENPNLKDIKPHRKRRIKEVKQHLDAASPSRQTEYS
jgi:hypothetical protein